jgi:hypothetical protein
MHSSWSILVAVLLMPMAVMAQELRFAWTWDRDATATTGPTWTMLVVQANQEQTQQDTVPVTALDEATCTALYTKNGEPPYDPARSWCGTMACPAPGAYTLSLHAHLGSAVSPTFPEPPLPLGIGPGCTVIPSDEALGLAPPAATPAPVVEDPKPAPVVEDPTPAPPVATSTPTPGVHEVTPTDLTTVQQEVEDALRQREATTVDPQGQAPIGANPTPAPVLDTPPPAEGTTGEPQAQPPTETTTAEPHTQAPAGTATTVEPPAPASGETATLLREVLQRLDTLQQEHDTRQEAIRQAYEHELAAYTQRRGQRQQGRHVWQHYRRIRQRYDDATAQATATYTHALDAWIALVQQWSAQASRAPETSR